MQAPRHNVVVVDDDDSVREVAQLSLELVAGWNVRVASDGRSALDLVTDELPEAMLLDVMMPGLDGVETLAELRRRPATADLPVILMTAKATTGSEPEWRGLDVTAVIAKPFDPMTLADRVRQLLGWS